MNKYWTGIYFLGLIVTVYVTTATPLNAQAIEDVLEHSFSAKDVFYLANVSGDVKVEGYDGDEFQIVAKRNLSSRKNVNLDELKERVKIGFIESSDSLIVYITGLGKCFCTDSNSKNDRIRYQYNWNQWADDVEQNFDFEIKIPSSTKTFVSTINNGDIVVKNMDSDLVARNINGDVELHETKGLVTARTINGDVTIDFDGDPLDGSRFYTLNGTIKANFPKNINAFLSFKSEHGDLFTNIKEVENMPTDVRKTQAKNGEGVSYKLIARSMLKIRNGGSTIDFETFNGDVYVLEK